MLFHRDEANLASAADRGRLLRGEPAELNDWEEVQRWIGIYEDLVSFNTGVIELVERRLESLPAGHGGPEEADLLLIQAHLGRLRERLEYWKVRSAQLKKVATAAVAVGILSQAQRVLDKLDPVCQVPSAKGWSTGRR
jgi:hypothetical protein